MSAWSDNVYRTIASVHGRIYYILTFVRLSGCFTGRQLIVTSDVFNAAFCAVRLKALSDPHRLRIVDALRYGELTVSDIAEFLEAEVVTVSHHLKIMKFADLVEVRRDGRFMYYRLHADLLCASGKGAKFLDLGCCRLEVPDRK